MATWYLSLIIDKQIANLFSEYCNKSAQTNLIRILYQKCINFPKYIPSVFFKHFLCYSSELDSVFTIFNVEIKKTEKIN